MVNGQPVLNLVEFRCCSDAIIRNITFNVDPRNRAFMSDTQGRVIGPQRALAQPDSEEWILLGFRLPPRSEILIPQS